MLVFSKQRDEPLSTVPVNNPLVSDVICHGGQAALVWIDQMVQRPFVNIKSAQWRQEVIANEKAKEYEIIDDSFEIKS